MKKTQIRVIAKQNRLNNSLKKIKSLNKLIRKNLFSYFNFSQYKNILIYLSSIEKGEVDTWNILSCLKNNIYVPVIDKLNNMYITNYTNTFVRNKFGIL